MIYILESGTYFKPPVMLMSNGIYTHTILLTWQKDDKHTHKSSEEHRSDKSTYPAAVFLLPEPFKAFFPSILLMSVSSNTEPPS